MGDVFKFSYIKPFPIISDLQQWNNDFSQEFVGMILVLIIHSHFQDIVDIFHMKLLKN